MRRTVMPWASNDRNLLIDSGDTGRVSYFDVLDVCQMLELEDLRKLWSLVRSSKIRPALGRGRKSLWTATEINALWAYRKLYDKTYIPPARVVANGPTFRGK